MDILMTWTAANGGGYWRLINVGGFFFFLFVGTYEYLCSLTSSLSSGQTLVKPPPPPPPHLPV